MSNPTIQRLRLGSLLKAAREAAGKTQDEAAAQIDAAASKISRLELGQSGLKLTDLGILLNLYGVTGEQAETMRELARAGRQRGRWSGYRAAIPDWFRQYADLEAAASEVRVYQTEVMPGILQTEAYIRAVNAAGGSAHETMNLDQLIAVRLERQAGIERPDAPQVSFILSESALRRRVGGPDVMKEQLEHLAEVGRRSNIELQVLAFDAQTCVPASLPFICLRFGDEIASDVVYLEDFTDATYLDRPEAVRAYARLWNRLQAAALGPVESERFILRVADQA